MLTLGGTSLADGTRPRVILFFVSGMGYAELTATSPLAELSRLAKAGSIAFLDTAVTGEPTEAAVYLTIGAGEKMTVPDKTSPKLMEGGIDRTVADVATDIFRCDTREGLVVAQTYRRRFDAYPPLRAHLVQIGVPTLRRYQVDTAHAARIGELGEALHRAGKRVTVLGDWQSALVAIDKRAALYNGAMRPLLSSEFERVIANCDVLIYNEEHPGRAPGFAPMLANLAAKGKANILLVCLPHPFSDTTTRPFLFALGPAFPAGSLLTSATIGKAGFVSSRDIAPTVALLAGAPFSGGSGHPLKSIRVTGKSWDVLAAVLRREAFLRQWGVYFGIGILLVIALIIALLFHIRARKRGAAGRLFGDRVVRWLGWAIGQFSDRVVRWLGRK
jgi:hypothetical protein